MEKRQQICLNHEDRLTGRYISKTRSQCLVVVEQVPDIRFSGTRNQPKNGWKASWKEFFVSFCHIFLSCLTIFPKSYRAFGVLDFEKSSNMAKIWQKMMKILLQLTFNTIFPWYCGYPKLEFRVPIPPVLVELWGVLLGALCVNDAALSWCQVFGSNSQTSCFPKRIS